MKKNLNEQVDRIKDMMKKINESQFNEIFDKPNDEDTSFERFKNSYHKELFDLKKSLNKITPEMIDNLSEDDIKRIEDAMSNYDKNVLSYIEHWVINPSDFSIRDIVSLAIQNSDRFGTEPKMVLYAIEDYLDFFGINPFEEEDDEEDDDEKIDYRDKEPDVDDIDDSDPAKDWGGMDI